MSYLQRTIPTFELPSHVDQRPDQLQLSLPALPADLPLYCHHCGCEAVAIGSQDFSLCADCYRATAQVCDECGEAYVGACCEECQVCCENCHEVIPKDEARTNDDGEHY